MIKPGIDIEKSLIYYPSFWLETWQKHRDNSLRNRRIQGPEDVNYWNLSAEKMKCWAEEDRSIKRVKKVINWIGQQGIQVSGMSILDIGAGTGSFAIPFAQMGAQVTVLEPAENLAKIMKDNMKREGVGRVSILTELWEDIHTQKEGLEAGFDLVFASLTPGIRDQKTLEKMITCSRQWCFLCELAGRRQNRAQEELWFKIFNEAMPLPEYNILYPLNYLYSLGYLPSLKLWREQWREETPGEEAVENLTQYFALYTKVTSKVEEVISDYVTENLYNGMFGDDYQSLLGMIVWKVNDKWDSY